MGCPPSASPSLRNPTMPRVISPFEQQFILFFPPCRYSKVKVSSLKRTLSLRTKRAGNSLPVHVIKPASRERSDCQHGRMRESRLAERERETEMVLVFVTYLLRGGFSGTKWRRLALSWQMKEFFMTFTHSRDFPSCTIRYYSSRKLLVDVAYLQ